MAINNTMAFASTQYATRRITSTNTIPAIGATVDTIVIVNIVNTTTASDSVEKTTYGTSLSTTGIRNVTGATISFNITSEMITTVIANNANTFNTDSLRITSATSIISSITKPIKSLSKKKGQKKKQ